MQLIWIILRWLYPRDPVRVSTLALREHVIHPATTICNAAHIALLDRDDAYRAHVESILIDYDAGLQRVIAQRACQIAGILFDPHHTRIYIPRHPRPTAELLARLGDLAQALDRIEHLAQIRAKRLMRERDADPLSLRASSPHRLDAPHRSTSPSFAGGGQRAVSSLAEGGGGGAPRSCVTEGAAREAGGLQRAPPVFDVHQNPIPASQASPARSRTCVRA